MVVANQSYWLCVSNLVHYLDAVSGFGNSEAFACQNLLVTLGVQFGETCAELELRSVDHDGSVCLFLTLNGIGWQCVCIDTQEVTHSSLRHFKISCHAVVCRDMHYVFRHRTEDPRQHVVEMYSDVCGDASALVLVAFP